MWFVVLKIYPGPTKQFSPNVRLSPISAFSITPSVELKLSPRTILPPLAVRVLELPNLTFLPKVIADLFQNLVLFQLKH
jgi:hypothetical protein